MSAVFDVVNMHFIDHCNYKCFMCFVDTTKQCLMDKNQAFQVVAEIESYFIQSNIKHGRINLVGGEPLLAPYIDDLIDYIASKNIKVSIVTNGSKLDEAFILRHQHQIEMIGISIDSFNHKTNIEIGRNIDGKVLPTKHIYALCQMVKSHHIKLKINICVSTFNLHENFKVHLKKIKPDRLKVFQMSLRESINDYAKQYAVNNHEFKLFCNDLEKFSPIVENSDDLENSYVIIDSKGNLIKTLDGKQLIFGNVLKKSLTKLVENIQLDAHKYMKRYEQKDIGKRE